VYFGVVELLLGMEDAYAKAYGVERLVDQVA
jgi:hypothetical protein